MNVGAMSILAGTNSGDLEKGRVLELMNMVTIEELMDGEEYEGMWHFTPKLTNIKY
jgi:splicing factor U2AF subunit